MSSQRTFMTPAQQREYLNKLRKQNDEVYNLTGARATGKDPWANPAPNPKAVLPKEDVKGPPTPPKNASLRSLPTPPKDQIKEKPKTLPKPPISVPDLSNLSIDTPRRLPPVPEKPSYIRASSSEPRKVSISLVNYDIPQIRTDTVAIPVLSFHNVENQHLKVPDQEDPIDAPAIVPRGARSPVPRYEKEMIRRGLHCANCYESLGAGRVITALGKRYHPSHFTCYQCDVSLEHVEFYAHEPHDSLDEEVYCHFDYHELFTPRCHVCCTPVIRNGVKALDRVYHSDHFFCALCSTTFTLTPSGVEFVERDGLAWHTECYEEKFSERYICRKCKEPILDEVVKLGTSFFHDHCFMCSECSKSLKSGFYWSLKRTGICKDCKNLELKGC